jgi:hypothetical protein
MMETKTRSSQEWVARRRVVLSTCCALLVGLIGWLWIRRPSSLQREVEAIGGNYVDRNLDLPWDRVARAVFQPGTERRSISIVFYKTDVTDDWVRRNAEAMKKLPMHFLNFRRTGITDDAVTDLAGMKRLTMLDIAGTSITDQAMSAIREMPDLKRIDLTDTDVTEDGISQLDDHPLLRHMDLDGDVLTDETVTHLNAMPGLRSLGLKGVNSDQLNRLGGLKNLEALSLTGTTNESLPFLLQLRQLKYLDLVDSGLSPDSVETIRMTLPNLTIGQRMSLEAAEELGIPEMTASRYLLIWIALFAAALSVGSLVLFVVLIWRHRRAKRHRTI